MRKQVTSYFKTGWDLKFYSHSTFFLPLESIFGCVILGLFFILILGYFRIGSNVWENNAWKEKNTQILYLKVHFYQDFFPCACWVLDCHIIIFWQCLVYLHFFSLCSSLGRFLESFPRVFYFVSTAVATSCRILSFTVGRSP